MKEREPLNLIVCGTGGQGNVLLSRLLARSFYKKGYNATVGETFGLSQRGGNVMSHVRISRKRLYGPLIPEGQGHIIVSLEPLETVRALGGYGNPEIAVISNLRPVYPIATIIGEKEYPDQEEIRRVIRELSAKCWFLDATQISLEMGNPILANMIMMGTLVQANVVDLTMSDIEATLHGTFTKKVAQTNIIAATRGMQAVQNQ
jgi:indolepyruvate ferredoxin oxidoreductase beta subunit